KPTYLEIGSIISKLSNLKQLTYLSIISNEYPSDILKSLFTLSSLKTCCLLGFEVNDFDSDTDICNIEYLTITCVNVNSMCQLLYHLPLLNRLIVTIKEENDPTTITLSTDTFQNLKHLELKVDNIPFLQIESLLLKFPYIEYLSFSSHTDKDLDPDLIDSQHWETIISSLTLLKHFSLYIDLSRCFPIDIDCIYSKFQTDFWINREIHVNYLITDLSYILHTIPYPEQTFAIDWTYFKTKSLNFANNYDRVHNLSITFNNDESKHSALKFTNLQSLQILDFDGIPLEFNESIELDKLRHLHLSCKTFQNMELLKRTKNLHSLTLLNCDLKQTIFNDLIVMENMSRIKELKLYGLNYTSETVDLIVSVFSNIESLTIEVKTLEYFGSILKQLLNKLTKLIHLQVYSRDDEKNTWSSWTKRNSRLLKNLCYRSFNRFLFFWL
ncbi:unnamed protein product, partial [Didymodactylos carnosus]